MLRPRWHYLAWPLLLMAVACSRAPETERHAFFALGTLVEVTIHDADEPVGDAVRAVEIAMLEDEQRWRAFGNGELAALNAAFTSGKPVDVPAEIADGIGKARSIAERSDGNFNPAIGRLVEAWGFHEEERPADPPPTREALAPLLPPPSLGSLKALPGGQWQSDDARLWLDMGAFAKGLGVERAVAILREHGIDNAIVNAGGDLKALGRHSDRAWRVGVRHPRKPGVLAALAIENGESVFTSGDYERFFDWQGERFHHILDPASGYPAKGITSATVIHHDAALADAAATALLVAGPLQWINVAAQLGIDKAMVVLEDGSIELTREMKPRASFETATTVRVRTP